VSGQQRKRAFQGLVGRPYDPDDAPLVEPVQPAAPPPRKRGRPPKGDAAMSSKERQQQSRARARQEDTAPERNKLIKLIVRRIKTSEHADPAAMRRVLGAFRDALDRLTLEDLTGIAETYDIHDMVGRSHLEGLTGTKMVGDAFINRLERIESRQTTKELYGGQKTPQGVAPNADEPDDDSPVPTSRVPRKDDEVTVWDLIPQITEDMVEGEETDLWDTNELTLHHLPELRCLVPGCDERFASWVEARQHVEERVKGAKKLSKHIGDLKEGNAPEQLVVEAQLRYQKLYWGHHRRAANFVTTWKGKRIRRKRPKIQ
jgi:hypothetical protein